MALDFLVGIVSQVKLACTLFLVTLFTLLRKGREICGQERVGRTSLYSTLTCMSAFNLEPNNYRTMRGRAVNGSQLGKDYIQLKSLLQPIRIYSRASLYGPNIGRPRKNVITLLDG